MDIAAGLEAAPDHAGLHRARVSAAWARSWEDGRALTPICEAWHAAEPDNLGYRVGLAAALQREDRKGSCERVSTLLDGLGTSDPSTRYEVLRVRWRTSTRWRPTSPTPARTGRCSSACA